MPIDKNHQQAPMNGAESVLRALVASGVDVCFANPGTSEMHFVNALDRVPGMRAVLSLFEGVVTGAADGYARMSRKPAATLCVSGLAWATGWRTCTIRARPIRTSLAS
jgi:acetolactate synthase-1/2/3 large subunit